MRRFQRYSSPNMRGSSSKYSPFPTRHRIKSFDPSVLVQNTPVQSEIIPEAYVPKHTFADFGLNTLLLSNISARNYSSLTPIQDQVIPLLQAGADVVGLADTGTGKTVSFLIPLIQKVANNKSQRVLIMAPTRELAVQIDQELRIFARQMGIASALCIGGVGMYSQIRTLSFNPNFVIGTPGRLKDLEGQGKINFSSFNNVVLDEVDRILDMGFMRDMTHILSKLSPNRQSAFFSATTTPEVSQIMQRYLKSPVTVSVKSKNVLTNISQEIIKTLGKTKIEVLHNLLIRQGFDKVLVFGRTKHGLEKLANDLSKRGFAVAAIHGNKSQYQRQRSLDQFKSNRVKVLLATDVASRGLDIDNVTHVINYDLPESYEDYIHRIGRTGRANKKGMALTLID